MPTKKRKILVHTCCAACASFVFTELEKENFEIIAFYYNPQTHGLAEYKRRLGDLTKLCSERNIKLIVPGYDVQEYFSIIMPFLDKGSIKYISDKGRYRRKRCQLCNSLVIGRTASDSRKMRLKYFTTTLLCSPYKDHNEIWDTGIESAAKLNLNFFYKDFRKGYWNGRNFARSHDIIIPTYCGCNDSLEEGRLE